MKITLALCESIYDCKIEITDSQGSRDYYIPSVAIDEITSSYVTVEVFDNDFNLRFTPVAINIKSTLDEIEENSWQDKFAKKAVDVLCSWVNRIVLQVETVYRVENIQDGDRLDINMQAYVLGKFDRYDLLELLPASYAFFEVSNFNHRYRLIEVNGKNRKEVMKSAKGLAMTDLLGNGFFAILLTYPIQVNRMRYITRNKTISRKLLKFNKLSDNERQKFLDKQEKFFDRY